METTTRKSRQSKSTPATAAPATEPVVVVEEAKPLRAKAFAPTDYVTVRNGFQGRLVYTSRKTGERYVWDEFGEEQEMEMSELKSARSANKKFFTDNWFVFDDPAVVDYLGVSMFYKNALGIEEFETLFDLPNAELVDRIAKLSKGQRKSVVYVAKNKINDGTIDSRQKIAALEKALGVDLIEK